MKGPWIGLALAAALSSGSTFAADGMITNEDLERRYPPEEAPTGDAGRNWIYERTRKEDECAALKQMVAHARHAVHDESDPRPYNDRATEYTKYQQQYLKQCREQ
jgi:hypothetical protein